jgi:DNA-binding IclR family transcriptional regulator
MLKRFQQIERLLPADLHPGSMHARTEPAPIPPMLPLPTRAARGSTALVPALSRALTLLERLARQREPMSLGRLATELALPKSSVHGLCNTLLSFGYLRRQPDGTFLIGPRVMSLAEAFVSGTDAAREFNALWADAGAPPEETVVMSVLSGPDALYVAVRNSARPLGLAFTAGMRLPAYLSGSGKAMLAYRDPDAVRHLYAGGLVTHLTRKGPRDVEALLKELALVRKRGYSIDDETVREGVYAIGAPVFDASGTAVAGVAVCINKALLGADRGERHRRVVLDVARKLSQRLGADAGPVEPLAATRRKPGGAMA